eukprot:3440186-Amphidinium_carterae.1
MSMKKGYLDYDLFNESSCRQSAAKRITVILVMSDSSVNNPLVNSVPVRLTKVGRETFCCGCGALHLVKPHESGK